MVSVDDLIISLRIDDTGNLGKLQKQLTSLVGTRGEKKLDLGAISPDIKRELSAIRTELSFISTQTVPEITDIKGLSESIHRDRKTIQRTFEVAANRLISEKTDAYQKQLAEYGVENRLELLEEMKKTISNFMGMMELGEMGQLPGKVMQAVDFAAKQLIAAEKLTEGPRKTLLNMIENAIGELNKTFSIILGKAGITHKPEFTLYQIRESWYRKMEVDFMEMKFDMGKFMGTDEKVLAAFEKIKDFVEDKEGITSFLNKAFEKLGIIPTIETFTKEAIKKSPQLQAIAKGMFVKGIGTKYGFFPGFHEYIRNILKKEFDLNVDDMYEKGRPDFVLLANSIENLQKVFPPDIAERLAKMVTFIELKSILTESNKEQFKRYKDMIGEEYLTGVAAMVKQSFTDYFPEIKTAMVNMINLLKELVPEMFKTEEQLNALSVERMEERQKTIQEAIATKATKESLEREQKEMGGSPEETGRIGKKIVDDLDDILGQLDDLDAVTKDTNKEVKKENIAGKDIVEKVDET